MKILILMPLDEREVYNSAAILRELPKDLQERCFTMPMFMEYAVQTKTSKNWAYAVFDAIVSAKNVYTTADKIDDDFILIGNLPKEYKFDAVFNVQALDRDEPYSDKFIEKLKTIVKGESTLEGLLDLHEGSESKFTMHNAKAIADFITEYIKTDPHLDKIKEKYKDRLNFKDVK